MSNMFVLFLETASRNTYQLFSAVYLVIWFQDCFGHCSSCFKWWVFLFCAVSAAYEGTGTLWWLLFRSNCHNMPFLWYNCCALQFYQCCYCCHQWPPHSGGWPLLDKFEDCSFLTQFLPTNVDLVVRPATVIPLPYLKDKQKVNLDL